MIALFTDFGTGEAYVAQMKGVIVSLAPQVPLLDLSHEAGRFAIAQAAYLLDKSARYFPAGTIFVAVVDPGVGTARRAILMISHANKCYVGPDNGLFTYVLRREGLQEAYELTNPQYFRTPAVSPTFHGRDIFAPVAAHLARGVPPTAFGRRLPAPVTLTVPESHMKGDTAEGAVVYIDHFGNIITNIPGTFLDPLPYGQRLRITLATQTRYVPYVRTYADGLPGQLVCLRSSDDECEVALPQGDAAASCQVGIGTPVSLRRVEGA